MADDTLARMFWARVDRGPSRPSQQFKQGGTWKTLTRKEVGELLQEAYARALSLLREKEPVLRVACDRLVERRKLSREELGTLFGARRVTRGPGVTLE